jgi:hypothetical protein
MHRGEEKCIQDFGVETLKNKLLGGASHLWAIILTL